MTILRVLTLDEVAASGHYDDMAELAVIFNHDIVECDGPPDNPIWRWKANRFICLFNDGDGPFFEGGEYRGERTRKYRGSIDLNVLWLDMLKGKFAVEEMMKFYMQIGYSLSGFGSVWGQRSACELNLPGAIPPASEDDCDYQTVLEYMLTKYKRQVLKL